MRVILIIMFGVLFSSCSTTRTLKIQKLREGTRITTFKENIDKNTGVATHDIYIYEAKKDVDVNIKVEEKKIRIIPFNLKNDFKPDTIFTKKYFDKESEGYRLADKFAFSSTYTSDELIKLGKQDDNSNLFYTSEKKLLDKSNFSYTETIKYTDNKFVFQTLTIPFKLRSKKGNVESNVSTGFNAGIAYGYQWNLVRLKPIYDIHNNKKVKMTGYDKKTFSFALSPFFGLTPVSLTPEHTNNTVTNSKTVLGFSYGGAGVFTFNRVNLGLAIGFDQGLNDSKDWIYQGELWTGIVIGLDLIK